MSLMQVSKSFNDLKAKEGDQVELELTKSPPSIKNPHIYVNQIDGIKEQIKRYEELPDLKAPKLWINPEVRDFFEFDNSKDLKDIKIVEYEHHGKISFPIF